jgi:hypothetical protein
VLHLQHIREFDGILRLLAMMHQLGNLGAVFRSKFVRCRFAKWQLYVPLSGGGQNVAALAVAARKRAEGRHGA